VLAAAEGQSDNAIARGLAVNRKTVRLWRERFVEQGLDSLWEVAPGRGRKPSYGRRKIAAIVTATLDTKPPGMTQWSCRQLAEAQGVSKSTVHNIWQAHHLQPHRDKTFKLSRDAKFLEKLTDVVGLYLNPPQQALVLCVDEKTQIQALDRTQPGLPMKKGRCGTMTHDYKRNGTTTLFAALNILDGTVVGRCMPSHTHKEFIKFLNAVERAVPAGTKFSYASVETQVLGLVLRNAVGRPVAEYLSEKIWRPMGAEADATWLIDNAGQESAYCCVNAVLRDYARLGLLLAHDGRLGDLEGGTNGADSRRMDTMRKMMQGLAMRADQCHIARLKFRLSNDVQRRVRKPFAQ